MTATTHISSGFRFTLLIFLVGAEETIVVVAVVVFDT